MSRGFAQSIPRMTGSPCVRKSPTRWCPPSAIGLPTIPARLLEAAQKDFPAEVNAGSDEWDRALESVLSALRCTERHLYEFRDLLSPRAIRALRRIVTASEGFRAAITRAREDLGGELGHR